MSEAVLFLPIFIASSMVDVGLSEAVCPDDQYLWDPLRCSEMHGGMFPPSTWGTISFCASSSSACLVPILLGMSPFAPSIAFTVLVAAWCLAGLLGFNIIRGQSKPKPARVVV